MAISNDLLDEQRAVLDTGSAPTVHASQSFEPMRPMAVALTSATAELWP